MNDSLSKKVRNRAMWCHLSGLTWLVSKIIVPLLFGVFSFLVHRSYSIAESPLVRSSYSIAESLLIPLVIADFLLPLAVPSGVWLMNRRLHPFIDLAGKATVNFLLTIILQIVSFSLLGIFMVGATCGIFVKNASPATMTTLMITFA